MSLKCFLFCGSGGDTEYLDDVEIFDGRRWKRANYKLDQVKKEIYFTYLRIKVGGGKDWQNYLEPIF